MADLTSDSRTENPWKLGGLSWKELAVKVWREAWEDDILGRAAQLAFYLLLALFPALLFLTALLGLFPLNPVIPQLMDQMGQVLPEDALSLVEKYLQQIMQGSGGGILSLGLLGALWASSSGLTAIMETLNIAYDAAESRSFWKVRLIAIALTVGLAGFIILATVLVLSGEQLGAWVANLVGLGHAFTVAWVVLKWPLVMALMLFAVAVIYYVAPNVKQDWRWVTPGSLFAVVMWLLVSLGFKLYVASFGDYNAAYGSIAGVIVLLLWFYLSGVVLLVGGEINSEVGRAVNARAERARVKIVKKTSVPPHQSARAHAPKMGGHR
jgi:membrane protein